MANIKISQLTNATTPLTGTEEVPIVQGGTTVKTAASNIGIKVNPTTTFVPYNNAGVFADSFLINDTNQNILKTKFNTFDQGLSLSFGTTVYKFGDFNYINQGTYININDSSQIINTYNQNHDYGLKLDFANEQYWLKGSANGILVWDNSTHNAISMYVGTAGKISTESDLGQAGLLFDFGLNIYKFGDYAGFNLNGTTLIIDDAARQILTKNNNTIEGFQLDFTNKIYAFGDIDGAAVGTMLNIDASNGVAAFFIGGGGGTVQGLKLDMPNSTFTFGDVNNYVGNYKLTINSNLGTYNLSSVTPYTDNANALANGLVAGDIYKFSDGSLHIVY